MTVTVKRIGGSMAVLIPSAMARQMDLVEGTAVDLTATNEAIVLRRQGHCPRRPVAEIVAEIKPSTYRRRTRELAERTLVGREIW